ncbi:hypothetical protein TSOC_005987 [Tetrabaena socialis]|uniref:Uncharacterized protein n=1 Tax=Tetrabaena socialis TaxID=47790 RepID=A0A2J8A4W5_9CHLO|nr:hypothetical protein TSOC_005987 [Tetrabaena socialis]|eukprot:PNH07545.1 hypothetical protein TSOC_005987 [Tetrabaena socialis]
MPQTGTAIVSTTAPSVAGSSSATTFIDDTSSGPGPKSLRARRREVAEEVSVRPSVAPYRLVAPAEAEQKFNTSGDLAVEQKMLLASMKEWKKGRKLQLYTEMSNRVENKMVSRRFSRIEH